MKRMLFAITLFAVLFAGSVDAQRPDNGTARTTRYWDSCKPSCGWTANANPACVDCDARGALLSNRNTQSICNNGSSYTCMFQAPFTGSDGRAYGFAASHTKRTPVFWHLWSFLPVACYHDPITNYRIISQFCHNTLQSPDRHYY